VLGVTCLNFIVINICVITYTVIVVRGLKYVYTKSTFPFMANGDNYNLQYKPVCGKRGGRGDLRVRARSFVYTYAYYRSAFPYRRIIRTDHKWESRVAAALDGVYTFVCIILFTRHTRNGYGVPIIIHVNPIYNRDNVMRINVCTLLKTGCTTTACRRTPPWRPK